MGKNTRRDFLQKSMLLFSLPFSLPTNFPFALQKHVEKGPSPFFVRIKVNGGWDTSLCFDPWTQSQRPDEKDFFLEYRSSEIKKVAGIYLGPAAHSFAPFADEMIVINGLVMGQVDQG